MSLSKTNNAMSIIQTTATEVTTGIEFLSLAAAAPGTIDTNANQHMEHADGVPMVPTGDHLGPNQEKLRRIKLVVKPRPDLSQIKFAAPNLVPTPPSAQQ
jgi:hypothetical protein